MSGQGRTQRRRKIGFGLAATAAVVTLLVAGAALGPARLGVGTTDGAAASSGSGTSGSTGDQAATTPVTGLETIATGDLVERQEETGAVAHGETWTPQIDAQGTVTGAPDVGTTINFGDTLLEVDAKPIKLAEGDVPLYRSLNYQARKHLKGPDVEQLQQFLIDAGYDDAERLNVDGDFGLSTHRAVKAWQKDTGRDQTGTVDRTQLVFSPEPLRIDTSPRVGSQFSELTVTEAGQRITAEFASRQKAFVEVGATVELQLGSGESLPGTITETTSTVSDQGDRVVEVTVTPDADLPPGTERVKVIASRVAASDVLTVAVRAVLALAGGGYGLEVQTGDRTELRPVDLGVVVDDVAEISGEFSEGDQVVVPIDLLDPGTSEDDSDTSDSGEDGNGE